ncbi:MAG: SGNH/GDSL hydrolase family protein [Acidimicrobiales bacterium]
MLGVSLTGFALWLLLDAPTLQHNAIASPVGTRRTVSLDILGPIATLSRGLGASHVVSIADGMIGRSAVPGGVADHAQRHLLPVAAPTTTSPTAPFKPTASDPLKVLVVGDSLGIDLGDVLVNQLDQTGVAQANLDGKVSSGLTRPDYFNWPAELQEDLSRYGPQVVVVMVGANDAQDIPGPPDVPYGSSAWDAAYRSRVQGFVAEALSAGAQVLWVGMPPMQDEGLSASMAHIDALVQGALSGQKGVDYLSTWTLLGGPSGTYTPYLDVGGQEVNIRTDDGTHLSSGGAGVVSGAVVEAIKSALHIPI